MRNSPQLSERRITNRLTATRTILLSLSLLLLGAAVVVPSKALTTANAQRTSAQRTAKSAFAGSQRSLADPSGHATEMAGTVTPSASQTLVTQFNGATGPAETGAIPSDVTASVFTAERVASIPLNAIDSTEYFVWQHYVDFLGRDPDEAGFNFWSNEIAQCSGDTNCIQKRRVNVSVAFFQSIEFQTTGGLVDGLYRATFDRAPQYAEFIPDTAAVAKDVVVGRAGWEQRLAANRQAFLDVFVQRPAFQAAYGSLNNTQYVETLLTHTRIIWTQVERDALVNGLASGSLSRAGVLGQIASDQRFVDAKFNQAFVMMEYFGYLRRDPDAAGYQFWLNKLNQFGGNFEQAEMVKSFLLSGEYRLRFGL